ncbi:MAG TPA: hypothetical protein VGC21_19400 [Telluria sp.]|jgi:hypothetical protein
MLESIRSLCWTTWQRTRSQFRQTLGFVVMGDIAAQLTELPVWLDRADGRGLDWLIPAMAREALSIFGAAWMLLLGFRLFAANRTDLVRRPLAFLFALLCSSSAGTLVALIITLLMRGEVLQITQVPIEKIFEIWIRTLLWGGLVGWLYVLNMQRVAHQLALDGLLSRRVLLAQKLARTRLGQARAQIDPAMVADILSQVHTLYRSDSARASALLDKLIGYLRLAMNRRPGKLADPDMALHAALAALRERDLFEEKESDNVGR